MEYKYTVITLNKKNIADFAKERNTLLKNSKTEWVFFLDSDEIMSKGLDREIKKQIGEGKHNGFYVRRKNYFLGKYIGTDKILRLGKKGAGNWVRRVHEVWMIRGAVGELKTPITHNTARNLHEYIGKTDFYSTLHARQNLADGKRSNLFKIVFYPFFKFSQSLLIGRGLVFSILQSFHSFLAWSKEWEFQKK